MPKARCAAITGAGKRCSKKPIDGSDYCNCHQEKTAALNVPKPLSLNDDSDDEIVDVEVTETNAITVVNNNVTNVEETIIEIPQKPVTNDDVSNVIDLLNELKIAKDQVNQELYMRDRQIDYLKQQLDAVVMLQQQTMQHIQQQKQQESQSGSVNTTTDTATSSRKKRNHSVQFLAKRLYYHENKKRPDIIATITDRLRVVNMFINEKSIPWQLVRAATDSIFEMLPDNEKNAYAMKAMQAAA